MIQALLGLAATGIGAALGSGKKPKLPDWNPIDVTKVQNDTIKGNIANFDDARQLANNTTEADQSSLEALLRRAIPGYDEIIKKTGAAISSGLSGELPADVTSKVLQHSAERSLSGGFSDSGASRALTARDLGTTSYDIISKSIKDASSFISNQRGSGMVNPTSASTMFLTPAQRVGFAFNNANAAYQSQTANAYNDAAPSPLSSAVGGILTNIGGSMFGSAMQSSWNNSYGSTGTASSGWGSYQPGIFGSVAPSSYLR